MDSSPEMPAPGGDSLLALAPLHLPNHRKIRYQGEDARMRLGDFTVADQRLLREIYASLLDLFLRLRPCHTEPGGGLEVLRPFSQNGFSEELGARMKRLGQASLNQAGNATDGKLARAVHDLRGGALQALSFRLQLFAFMPTQTKGLSNVFFLVRDHLKIMRNCVEDLDPERFQADAVRRDHDAALLVEKWSQAEFSAVRRPVRVVLDCRYPGTLCESCLEFSTLDRIIYNLMNNAAEHAADGQVHFYVLPVPEAEPENIRFVFLNRVTPEHRQVLRDAFHDDLGDLFRGGFTTQGHGVGSRICADFCAQAYGLPGFQEAKEGGYIGAKWLGDTFAAWFHWPVAGH